MIIEIIREKQQQTLLSAKYREIIVKLTSMALRVYIHVAEWQCNEAGVDEVLL